MVEKCQERHRTKRSASGKLKHKQKTKSASEAVLKVRVKRKRYQRLEQAAKSIGDAISLPRYALVKSVSATQDALSLTVSLGKSSWDFQADEEKQVRDRADLLAAMFLSLYYVLNSSKTAGKA